MDPGGRGDGQRSVAITVAGLLSLSGLLLTLHLDSDSHRIHDPLPGLRQLALYYLDEPAPLLDRIGGPAQDRPLLLVVCEACQAPALGPDVDVEVRITDDPEVARAYALMTAAGRIGPGYAIIDAGGNVRYRTFDPNLAGNGEELRVLLRALNGGRVKAEA